MREDAARWFAKAEEDLADARLMLEAERASPSGFFAHQAAAKALAQEVVAWARQKL